MKGNKMFENVTRWETYPDGWTNGYDADGRYVVALSPDDAEDLGVR